MAEQDEVRWYLKGQSTPSLYGWVFQNMALGAAWAAVVFFGVIFFILILKAIGRFLPEDPYAMLAPAAQAVGLA